MAFTVHPTLFIGIGSTGTEILDRLRKYVYEEFGKAGLPCFRYVALETNKNTKLDDTFPPYDAADYEKVKMVYITIPQLGVIRTRLDPNSPSHLKGVNDWLDQSVFDIASTGFTAGAGNRRHAGRLCLWENWENLVKGALRTAYTSINEISAQDQTDKFLRKNYLPRRMTEEQINNLDNVVDSSPRVFIFGTLCGGTGSGTFIDLAYYVKNRLLTTRAAQPGHAHSAQVMGLFTIPSMLSLHDNNLKVFVVNTWTALKELDFYSHGLSQRVVLPDGDGQETDDAPFDLVYLASPQNSAGKIFGGDYSKALSDMSALTLFTEIVPGVSAAKAAYRVDFRAANAGYMEANEKGRIRAFSAFGLSAIWYPRYRIGKAITMAIGERVAQEWAGRGNPNLNVVAQQVESDWSSLFKEGREFLMGAHDAPGATNIRTKIGQLFEERAGEFISLEKDSLRDFILNFPAPEKTLSDMFSNPNGSLYQPISLAQGQVTAKLKEGLTAKVESLLVSHTAAQTKYYLEQLNVRAENSLQQLPEALGAFSAVSDGEQEVLSFAPHVFHDMPTKFLLMKGQSLEHYKRYVWDVLKQQAQEHAEKIAGYFLRLALRPVINHIQNLAAKVQTAQVQLDTFAVACKERYREQVKFDTSVNVFPISRENPESLEDDVELALRSICGIHGPADLKRIFVDEKNPLALALTDVNLLLSHAERVYDQLAQTEVIKFKIGAGALEQFKGKLPNIVGAAAPYVQTVPEWQSMANRLQHSPNMLFCHDTTAGQSLATAGSAHMPGSPELTAQQSPLDHFVMFYREEPGIAISDLAIAQGAESILREYEARSQQEKKVTSFTHRMGEKYFDINVARNFSKAQKLVELSIAIAPEKFPQEGQHCFMSYSDQGFNKDLAITDPKSLREFLNKVGFEQFEKVMHEKLKGLGHDPFRERVNTATAKLPLGLQRERLQTDLRALAGNLFPTAMN